jgi:hypothetical protein
MNNKVLCCLICIIIIVVILVNIITSNKEKFGDYPPTTINSIVSRIDGTMLNVEVTDQSTGDETDKTIKIKVDNDNILCMDSDTKYLSKCPDDTTWILKFIVDEEAMRSVIDDERQIGNAFHPFYMVLTQDAQWALQYNNGRFSVAPVGNYESQKWDVSHHKIPERQLFVRDIYDGPLDKMPYSKNSNPKDRIKINLKINDEKLKKLLHIDSDTSGTIDSSKCGTYVPNTAVENLCSGCKV